ncbi:hypothetical protein BD309DRAFT_553755 [Dichomitus squalens]|uniref:Uncharacterized protein n=2 Tax=Dichomitus squalens TaxID=114155 RepID=A0A4Q9MGR0_9APHY|nr:uncharacterized protein DICSQDRAFT_162810 [Dichomitus squalens LYAD-421 SS1]EJF58571.1 hypothetical protein DICSQDRAFT_162810 [Dichomitus squalens LYAD-421 SS1]TBU25056.1 hypothetical protein BD311DRAFT_528616 [Dichomitus squalens]TBU38102.1 hypothetical protein BD309DRAFT_553755 [Dichomitus squalens]TBU65190.1 hypothetical protein BD310DRAFT_305383 [Dichomitus squalens]
MAPFSPHAGESPSSSPRLRSELPQYSPIPATRRSLSPLINTPFPGIELDRAHETEPKRHSIARRIWNKITSSLDWEELGFFALLLIGFVFFFAFGVAFSFGLNVASVYVGGRILHYKTSIATIYYNDTISPAFARVVLAGSAIVDTLVVFITVGAVVLAERRHQDNSDAGDWALWGTLSLGIITSSAVAASVGILVVPGDLAPEGLRAIQALAAGSLGTIIAGIPLFIFSVLYFIGS